MLIESQLYLVCVLAKLQVLMKLTREAQKNVMGARTSAASANAQSISNIVGTVSKTTFPTFNADGSIKTPGNFNTN